MDRVNILAEWSNGWGWGGEWEIVRGLRANDDEVARRAQIGQFPIINIDASVKLRESFTRLIVPLARARTSHNEPFCDLGESLNTRVHASIRAPSVVSHVISRADLADNLKSKPKASLSRNCLLLPRAQAVIKSLRVSLASRGSALESLKGRPFDRAARSRRFVQFSSAIEPSPPSCDSTARY